MSEGTVRVSALKAQIRDKSRVNVYIDGKYTFSLDVTQVVELGVRVGKEYSSEELASLENEAQFGKVYTRSLEYALTRPRSKREMKEYLYKKTRDSRMKNGEMKKGVSPELTDRVFEKLTEKGYLDDEKFARFWLENRNVRKGSSMRKLEMELRAKGVETNIITTVIAQSSRSNDDELQKIIAKKAYRYDDQRKFMQYLVGQGFSYDEVRQALEQEDSL